MDTTLREAITAAVTGFSTSGPEEVKSSMSDERSTSRHGGDAALEDLHVSFPAESPNSSNMSQGGGMNNEPNVQLIPIHVEILGRWRLLGANKGLASDTQIASYLLQHYDSTMDGVPPSSCINCHCTLPLFCPKCNPSSGTSTIDMSSLMEDKKSDDSDDDNKKKKKKKKGKKKRKGPYTCEECGTYIVPEPKKKKRNKLKPYQCRDCGATFAYRTAMEAHLFQTQDGPGLSTHKCIHCGLVVLNINDMRNHTLKHTAEMPFKCQYCPLAFSQACNLKAHMRTHTGERPFSCDVCHKAFSQSVSLKTHMRRHTGEKPFQCTLCDKAFAASSNLSRHMMKHTGERPYKCQYCAACFSQPGSLKTHIRKHTGEKPFKCDICSMAFSDHASLYKHKRRGTCSQNAGNIIPQRRKVVRPKLRDPPPRQPPQPKQVLRDPPPRQAPLQQAVVSQPQDMPHQPTAPQSMSQPMLSQPGAMPMSSMPMVSAPPGQPQVYRPPTHTVDESFISSWVFPMQQQQQH